MPRAKSNPRKAAIAEKRAAASARDEPRAVPDGEAPREVVIPEGFQVGSGRPESRGSHRPGSSRRSRGNPRGPAEGLTGADQEIPDEQRAMIEAARSAARPNSSRASRRKPVGNDQSQSHVPDKFEAPRRSIASKVAAPVPQRREVAESSSKSRKPVAIVPTAVASTRPERVEKDRKSKSRRHKDKEDRSRSRSVSGSRSHSPDKDRKDRKSKSKSRHHKEDRSRSVSRSRSHSPDKDRKDRKSKSKSRRHNDKEDRSRSRSVSRSRSPDNSRKSRSEKSRAERAPSASPTRPVSSSSKSSEKPKSKSTASPKADGDRATSPTSPRPEADNDEKQDAKEDSSSVSDAGSLLDYDADELVEHITKKTIEKNAQAGPADKEKAYEDLKNFIADELDIDEAKEEDASPAPKEEDDSKKSRKNHKSRKKKKKGDSSTESFDPNESDSEARRARHERRRKKRDAKLAEAKQRRLERAERGTPSTSSSSSDSSKESNSAHLDPDHVEPSRHSEPPPEILEREYPEPVLVDVLPHGRVQSGILAPCGTLKEVLFVVCLRDGSLVGYRIPSGTVQFEFKAHHTEVRSLVCHEPSGNLYTACKDGSIRGYQHVENDDIYDRDLNPEAGLRRRSPPPPPKFDLCNEWNEHQGAVNVITIDKGSGHLISGGMDRFLFVFDLKSGDTLDKYVGHKGPIVCVDSCSQFIASGSEDKTIILWDRSKGQSQMVIEAHSALVSAVAFVDPPPSQSDDDSDTVYLASGSWDGSLKVWNCSSGIDEASLPVNGRIYSLSTLSMESGTKSGKVSPLCSLGEDNTLRVWDWHRKVPIAAWKSEVNIRSCYGRDTQLVTTAAQDQVTVYNGALASQRGLASLDGHTGTVNSVRYSRDGDVILTGSRDETVRVWNSSNGTLTHSLQAEAEVWCCDIAPDASIVCAGCEDSQLRVWDLETPEEPRHTLELDDVVQCCAISPLGDRAVAGTASGCIMSWSAKMWVEMGQFQGHTDAIVSVQYVEGGRKLLSASSDQTLRIWNTNTRECDKVILLGLPVNAMSVSGLHVACALEDFSVMVHNIRTHNLVTQLKGHTGRITCMRAIDDAGTLFLSSSWDNTVRLWNIHASEQLVAFTSHDGVVSSLDFNAANLDLVTGCRDKSIHINTVNPKYLGDAFDGKGYAWNANDQRASRDKTGPSSDPEDEDAARDDGARSRRRRASSNSLSDVSSDQSSESGHGDGFTRRSSTASARNEEDEASDNDKQDGSRKGSGDEESPGSDAGTVEAAEAKLAELKLGRHEVDDSFDERM